MKLGKKIEKYFWRFSKNIVSVFRLDKLAAQLGIFTPRVVVRVDGGLASQINFFAVGYVVAKRNNLPLYLDITWFEENGKDLNGIDNRPFNLFNAFPRIKEQYGDKLVTSKELSTSFCQLFSDQKDTFSYRPELFSGRSVYLNGYYSNVKYLIDSQKEIAELMQFGAPLTEDEEELLREISDCTSCALHIRRGDYCGSVHEVCTKQYYEKAIEHMRQLHPDVNFYVFTNDEPWAEEFMDSLGGNIRYVLLKNRAEALPIADMHLMSACKHAIISNSGFSFFPAFLTLGNHKDVIMPEFWYGGKLKEKSRDIYYVPGWHKIPVD